MIESGDRRKDIVCVCVCARVCTGENKMVENHQSVM